MTQATFSGQSMLSTGTQVILLQHKLAQQVKKLPGVRKGFHDPSMMRGPVMKDVVPTKPNVSEPSSFVLTMIYVCHSNQAWAAPPSCRDDLLSDEEQAQVHFKGGQSGGIQARMGGAPCRARCSASRA